MRAKIGKAPCAQCGLRSRHARNCPTLASAAEAEQEHRARLRRCGVVRLDSGTQWTVPVGEWQHTLRYGADADVLKLRLSLAAVLASYGAVLMRVRSPLTRELCLGLAQIDKEREGTP